MAGIQAGEPVISEAEVQETVERITQVSGAARPLMSPLLLENSTNTSTQVDPILERAIGSRPIQQWDIAASTVTWSTPRKAVDLEGQLA